MLAGGPVLMCSVIRTVRMRVVVRAGAVLVLSMTGCGTLRAAMRDGGEALCQNQHHSEHQADRFVHHFSWLHNPIVAVVERSFAALPRRRHEGPASWPLQEREVNAPAGQSVLKAT